MIERDPVAAASVRHDLVVVGGGVYGTMVALEAARRGLRPLLLERADFGGETSWNHFRIVHGGLRYLQTLDLRRFRASVRERRWFLASFPDLVSPRAFLMPLYGRGLHRPAVLRAALALNDLLSRDRNRGVEASRRLPSGRVLGADETAALFPPVQRAGLRGGAVWYDAVMEDPPRLLVEALRWACAAGATCLNYVEATGLEAGSGAVAGVRAVDRATGREHAFEAAVVINSAGPWSRRVAEQFDRDVPRLFLPSLAFNVLLDIPPPETGVAVTLEGGPTYFLQPWRGHTLAGTRHVVRRVVEEGAGPTGEEVEAFVDELAAAAPRLGVHAGLVRHTFAGYLPARRWGTPELRDRAIIHDHGRAAGPRGLFSVSGVKYTTARRVAERALGAAYGRRLPPVRDESDRPPPLTIPTREELHRAADADPAGAAARLRSWVADEAVLHLDDLLLRRTEWGFDAARLMKDGRRVAELLGWGSERTERELTRLARTVGQPAAA